MMLFQLWFHSQKQREIIRGQTGWVRKVRDHSHVSGTKNCFSFHLLVSNNLQRFAVCSSPALEWMAYSMWQTDLQNCTLPLFTILHTFSIFWSVWPVDGWSKCSQSSAKVPAIYEAWQPVKSPCFPPWHGHLKQSGHFTGSEAVFPVWSKI